MTLLEGSYANNEWAYEMWFRYWFEGCLKKTYEERWGGRLVAWSNSHGNQTSQEMLLRSELELGEDNWKTRWYVGTVVHERD